MLGAEHAQGLLDAVEFATAKTQAKVKFLREKDRLL